MYLLSTFLRPFGKLLKEKGIPYKTLISSVIHRYIASKLVDRYSGNTGWQSLQIIGFGLVILDQNHRLNPVSVLPDLLPEPLKMLDLFCSP
jgi:hypothetical protein